MIIVQLANLPVSVASWDSQENPSFGDGVVDDAHPSLALMAGSSFASVMCAYWLFLLDLTVSRTCSVEL